MRPCAACALALLLSSGPAIAQSGVIAGTVYDSLRSSPLRRAIVVATPVSNSRDTAFHGAITDDKGRFRIDGLSDGRYDLSVDHEAMDSVGVHVPAMSVDVSNVKPRVVSLATPSAATVRHLLCGDARTSNADGTMVGVVRNTDGTPVRGASVVFNWSDFDLDRTTLKLTNRTESAVAVTNDVGVYRQCGLPVARSVLVQAQLPDSAQSGILEERISTAGVLVRDFRVGSLANSAGGLVITGSVADVNGQPIANAQINMPSAAKTAVSNESGEFRISGVPEGTQAVELLALGYYPVSIRVEVDRTNTPLRVRMERTAVILDSMRVIAARSVASTNPLLRAFEERARTRQGSFMTRARLDSIRPVWTSDALRRMAGVRVVQAGGRSWQFNILMGRGAQFFGSCAPKMLLNGFPVDQDVILALPMDAVYGIEAYTASTIPPQYGQYDCAILFWTR